MYADVLFRHTNEDIVTVLYLTIPKNKTTVSPKQLLNSITHQVEKYNAQCIPLVTFKETTTVSEFHWWPFYKPQVISSINYSPAIHCVCQSCIVSAVIVFPSVVTLKRTSLCIKVSSKWIILQATLSQEHILLFVTEMKINAFIIQIILSKCKLDLCHIFVKRKGICV